MIKRVFVPLLLAFSVIFGTVAFASDEMVEITDEVVTKADLSGEPEATPSPEPTGEGESKLVIEMDLIDHPIMIDTIVRAYFLDKDGNELAMDDAWVGGITKKITLELESSKFLRGQLHKVKFTGLRSVTYKDKSYAPREEVVLDSSDGTCNFQMTGDKPYELQPVIYTPDGLQKLSPRARVINGTTMVPVFELGEKLGLNVGRNEKYNSIAVWVGNKKVAFNVGSSITNVFGTDVDMGTNIATLEIDGKYYVPARKLAEYFECPFKVLDFGDHIDVCYGESAIVKAHYDATVGNISSKTDWLIHVDKSDYRVRVFKGSKGKWIQQKSYPCAIGAPGTPTITGEYEYTWKETIWPYNGYYVGPIMRFYRGYALHSTLRYYGGGEYDGRVGVMISHGCIRLHPEDIQWMWDNIPLKTKIYITE